MYVCLSHLTCAFHPRNWFWQCQCWSRFNMDYSHVKFDFVLFLSNAYECVFFLLVFSFFLSFPICFFLLANFQPHCARLTHSNMRTKCDSYRHLMLCASKKFTCFFVCSFLSIQFVADYNFSILLLDCLVEHAYFISHCVAISPYK